MSKLELLNSKLMTARKTGDELTKNLLLTMKGEVQNKSKSGNESEDELVEKTAKSMIKSASQLKTEDSLLEIAILNEFLPQMLTEDEIREQVEKMTSDSPGKPFGFYMGQLMKLGTVDGVIAKRVLSELVTL